VKYAGAVRFLLVLLVACGAARPARPKPTVGAIAGLARDTKSGESIGMAEVTAGTHRTTTNPQGLYDIDGLAPGTYTVVGRFADQPVTVKNVPVTAGIATYVDLPFTLGEVTPIEIDFGDPRAGEIQYFTTATPRIEGTVAEAGTRERVVGAVVTAARGPEYETLQTVTDDNGRYRFDQVMPGTYAVSAYYSIGGRAQIEVRRSDIEVKAEQGVLVPLWIELSGQ
jgi:hypothetical protein